MKLKTLSLSDVEQVRQWRNQQIEMLRTPFLLTQQQQSKFYTDVVCNRQANSRYWGIFKHIHKEYSNNNLICDYGEIIGMVGLENISWENRNAEISLILNPEYPMNEYGEEALRLILHEGFMNMNLENIYTEVYLCSRHINFWNKYFGHSSTDAVILPNRKYYNGSYWNSLYIQFNKERYNENTVS